MGEIVAARMRALRRVIRSGYFPSSVGPGRSGGIWSDLMFDGFSLLSRSHPPLETLARLLFIYVSLVL